MKVCVLENPMEDGMGQVWFVDTNKFNLSDPVHVAYKNAIDREIAHPNSANPLTVSYDEAVCYGGHNSLQFCDCILPATIDAYVTIWVESK